MIQRKQTVFLFFALALTVICLSMPIGHITPKGMGTDIVVTNLGIRETVNYTGWPMLAFLLVTCPLNILAIFSYNNRKLQMRLCTWCIIMCAAWYVYYLFAFFNTYTMVGTFSMNWTVALPLVSVILYWMAHRGIKKDDELIKSADRIR